MKLQNFFTIYNLNNVLLDNKTHKMRKRIAHPLFERPQRTLHECFTCFVSSKILESNNSTCVMHDINCFRLTGRLHNGKTSLSSNSSRINDDQFLSFYLPLKKSKQHSRRFEIFVNITTQNYTKYAKSKITKT